MNGYNTKSIILIFQYQLTYNTLADASNDKTAQLLNFSQLPKKHSLDD